MRAMIVGIGDAFTAHYFGTSAIVEAPDGLVLIDCPELIHRALREASSASGWTISADVVHDVILTHLHGDHCNGLESFAFHHRIRRLHGESTIVPRLYAAARVIDRLWERLAPAMDAPMDGDVASTIDDYFEVRELVPGETTTVAGLDVDVRYTIHAVPTIGLRVTLDGATLGWSGDTAFDPAHIDWLADADLIVHECNRGPVHTHLDELEALDDAVRSRIHLIHCPDDFDRASCPFPVLEEGAVLTIGPPTTE